VNTLGGFKAQGRDPEQWAAIEADAHAVADAGAFSIVVEAVAEPLAAKITREVAPPTIGIGGSPECDGQILVLEDMLGLSPKPPRFVRPYGKLAEHIREAVGAYAADVRSRSFPALENTYPMRKVRQA
jgi:3-methyl-2-oxobutanoate hydroxymethyltransferase